MGRGDRPEHSAPPEVFYDESEASKYTSSSRVIDIQEKLTARATELLALEADGVPKFILDIGCGSGLSGQVLTDEGEMRFSDRCMPAFIDCQRQAQKPYHAMRTSATPSTSAMLTPDALMQVMYGSDATYQAACCKSLWKRGLKAMCSFTIWAMACLSGQARLTVLSVSQRYSGSATLTKHIMCPGSG
jgi:hypothetical protein